MGKAQSKRKGRLRASRSTLSSNEPLLLGTSLDLIYHDNFFDNPRYRKLLQKYQKAHGLNVASESALMSKRKRRARFNFPPKAHSDSTMPSTLGIGASRTRMTPRSRPVSPKLGVKAKKGVPPEPPSSQLKGLDTQVYRESEKNVEKQSEELETGQTPAYGTRTETASKLPLTRVSRIPRPAVKQRSTFTAAKASSTIPSSITSHKSDYEVYQRPSLSSSRTRARSQPPPTKSRPGTATLTVSTISDIEKPHQTESETKKKLVVRGLRKYVNTRRRFLQTTSGHHEVPGRPAMWNREFPLQGKFHPDKYIYEFEEGPKCPPRPVSAMAKCKKHGGRCDTCGIYTCDLCQCCKKCEIDCGCPKVNTTCPPNPYAMPMDVYSELFRGDGWKKTCKVLCDLTEKEKMNPVGGNATKANLAQKCTKRLDPVARNQMYSAQIDVLNPYKGPACTVEVGPSPPPAPGLMPPPYPMCGMPSMFPMPFMAPMMPPMMPFYHPSPFYPPPPPLPHMMMPPPPPPPQEYYNPPPIDSFASMPNY